MTYARRIASLTCPTSAVADEVHLHGHDEKVDVPANGTATLTFTATIPGIFA